MQRLEQALSEARKALRLGKWLTTSDKACRINASPLARERALEIVRLVALSAYFLFDNASLFLKFYQNKRASQAGKLGAICWAISGIIGLLLVLRRVVRFKWWSRESPTLYSELLAQACDIRLALTGAGLVTTTRRLQGVCGVFSSVTGLRKLLIES